MKRLLAVFLSILLLCTSLLTVHIVTAEDEVKEETTVTETVEESTETTEEIETVEDTAEAEEPSETTEEAETEEDVDVTAEEQETEAEETVDSIPDDDEQEDASKQEQEAVSETVIEETDPVESGTANEETEESDEAEQAEPDETKNDGQAYAILTDEGDLIYFRSETTYTNGEEYTIYLNSTEYAGIVYSGIETLEAEMSWDEQTGEMIISIPWYSARDSIKTVSVAHGYTIKPISMAFWFYRCSSMVSFNGTGFDTSDVTDMWGTFEECPSLVLVDLSGFNTSNVTNMKHMFANCSSLVSLDLTGFDTSSLELTGSMFNGCSSLLSLDISNFITPNVTLTDSMFLDCSSLISLDISGFDTSKVIKMECMFDCCSLASIVLGPGFTKWQEFAELPAGNWTNSSLGITKTATELQQQYPSHAEEWAGTWTREIPLIGDAYAILTDDGEFIFFRSETAYTNGEEYTIYLNNNSYTGTVYSGIEAINAEWSGDGIPWSDWDIRQSIRNVIVAEGHTIKPISTAYWFNECYDMVSFDGTGFNTMDVTNMRSMFSSCSSLTSLDLSSFNTSNVQCMNNMFEYCYSMDSLDLSGFNTSNVTDMNDMFYYCSSLTSLDLSSFNTSNVTAMESMLSGCSSLESLGLSSFNTSNVTNMRSMFSSCSSLESLGLSSFNTSNVTDMSNMFSSCSSLTSLDLSSFNTSNVTDMNSMFAYCSSLTSLDLSSFNTSIVTNMDSMFSGCSSLEVLDLSGFDTSNVTDMSYMFSSCSSLTSLDVSSFNTSNVTAMESMLGGCSSLTSLDLSGFDTSNVVSMSYMFSSCNSLTSIRLGKGWIKWVEESYLPGGEWINQSLGITKTEKELYEQYPSHAEDWAGTWTCSPLCYAVLKDNGDFVFFNSLYSYHYGEKGTFIDTNGVSHAGTVFPVYGGRQIVSDQAYQNMVINVYVADNQLIVPIGMSSWFSGLSSMKSFDGIGFDTSNVTDMSHMFSSCSSLASLDLGSFDTSNVTDMSWMFFRCTSLASLDLSNFNTSKVTCMDWMFRRCSSLTSLDLSSFDTSNVTSMGMTFDSCSSLEVLDLSGFNTSNVTFMNWMFSYCSSLTSLDLSSFDTSNVESMFSMFYGCSSLVFLDLSSFDTSSLLIDEYVVGPMENIFYDCTSLTAVALGRNWHAWGNEAYLPEGNWLNLSLGITKTETELYEQYPTHASEWAGTWYKEIGYTFDSFIWNETEQGYEALAGYYGNGRGSYVFTIEADVTADTVQPGCETEGQAVYTAIIDESLSLDNESHTDSMSVILPPAGHRYNEPSYQWFNNNALVTAIVVCANDSSHVIFETVYTTTENVDPTCTEQGMITYRAEFENEHFTAQTKMTPIEALGHSWNDPIWTWSSDYSIVYAKFICSRDQSHSQSFEASVEMEDILTETTYTASVEFEGQVYTDTKIIRKQVDSDYIRIYRSSRLTESIKVADELKSVLGIEKFNNIIIAKDSDFADALSGSYLAARKDAPILLVNNNNHEEAFEYIYDNLSDDGTVYILGGNSAVSYSFEEELDSDSIEVVRIEGSSRYMTNLDILTEAGMTSSGDIFIVTGTGYADSLSSASVGLPILMVDNNSTTLKNSQKKFLQANVTGRIYILGDTPSVSKALEKQLKSYGPVTRIGGSSRWETTRLIAERFFPSPDYVTLATGNDFADGLIASPLAYALHSPLIMCASNKTGNAKTYVSARPSITKAYIVGSKDLISDEAARKILLLEENEVILER